MPRPWAHNAVMIGKGAAMEPSTIPRGAAGTVLTQTVAGDPPAFAAPASVSLTTGVSGILPIGSGGSGHTAGVLVPLLLKGTAVAAGSTVFLMPNGEDATE